MNFFENPMKVGFLQLELQYSFPELVGACMCCFYDRLVAMRRRIHQGQLGG